MPVCRHSNVQLSCMCVHIKRPNRLLAGLGHTLLVWAQESLIGFGHIGDTWRTQLNDSDPFWATMQPCVKLLCPLVIIIVTASINIHDQNRSKWTGGVDFALSLSPRRQLCRAAVQFFPPSTKERTTLSTAGRSRQSARKWSFDTRAHAS